MAKIFRLKADNARLLAENEQLRAEVERLSTKPAKAAATKKTQ